MPAKFALSTNIIRDIDVKYDYLVTANAENTISNIISDFNTGIHSSIIIGGYGTGKSTLLWAFEQSLKQKEDYFDVSALPIKKGKVKFIRIVGEYQSIIDTFSEQLDVKNNLAGNQKILDAIFQQYEEIKKDGLLVIYIDELGKFLEHAVQHNTENELYFLQQLAEFVNAPGRNIMLISTLHQNFDTYAFNLDKKQRNEWTKVRGRYKEITFNEPVEQLILLAAEHINHTIKGKFIEKDFEKIAKLVIDNKLFAVTPEFLKRTGTKLYPLDFVSAYTLTKALQVYSQNERSLFTFLASKEFASVKEGSNTYFNLVWLYDYLWANMYSLLNSKLNPHFNMWIAINEAIERAESVITSNTEEAIQVLKIIGLLSIFSSKGARINHAFLETYLDATTNIKSIDEIIKNLVARKIIIYAAYVDSYRIFGGTDIDIDEQLRKAGSELDDIKDISSYLNKHVGPLPLITANRITYETGTPRLFAFHVSEIPKYNLLPEGPIDGYINLIINEDVAVEDIKKHSVNTEDAVIYGYYKNSKTIKGYLTEIEKSLKVRAVHNDDKVVRAEMDGVIQHYIKLVQHFFIDSLYTEQVQWFYRGKEKEVKNRRQFNQWLSEICASIYDKSPIFKNELVNRHKISGAIHTARKSLFSAIANEWDTGELFNDSKFPPEKTIYHSLLKINGIHRETKEGYVLMRPFDNSSFKPIWDACDAFIESTRHEKRPLSELYDIVLNKPYKIKLGLAEFLIPLYLFIKREDYALFGQHGYIPEVNETIMLLTARNIDEYSVKAFNIEGVKLNLFNKYREFLKLKEGTHPGNKSFIESIKPFLVFYRQLPEYAKNTKRLTTETKAVRDAISKSVDPEKTFFEDFPRALHTSVKDINSSQSSLNEFILKLKGCIDEMRTAYDELLKRFEGLIQKEAGLSDKSEFLEYKSALQSRVKGIKTYLLVNYQKQFYQSINNPIDERDAWLSALSLSLIAKPLNTIKDEDEKVLFDKFKSLLHELDNYVEVSKTKADTSTEKVYRFEITTEKYNRKVVIKLPITKFEQLDKTEKDIQRLLDKDDKQLNIAILTKLLQDQINNE